MRALWGSVLVFTCPAFSQDNADAYMRNLALAGNVQTENGAVADPRLNANTRFELSYQANWDYELSIVKRNGAMELLLTPEFRRIDVVIKHKLRLPQGEDIRTERYRKLLLHEYDHVAISTDTRPRMLLRQLILSIGTIRRPWSGPVPPSEGDMHSLIQQEIEARKNAVVATIDLAYRKLDEISDHGRRPIPDRNAFFYPLFSRDYLEKMKFAYFADAAKVFNNADYLAAKRYYRS